jgi:meso-butanediol dehydrogenase / (S,S)-butanediol dehydrogenase / diacetyl reductase
MKADAARLGGRLAGMTALVTGARHRAGDCALVCGPGDRDPAGRPAGGAGRGDCRGDPRGGRRRGGGAVDAADETAVRALFERLPEGLAPRLDVLGERRRNRLHDDRPRHSLELWERVSAGNARGTFLMSKHALPRLRTSPGAIVKVGSVAGMVGLRNRAAYCASKGAVAALTGGMAIDHRGRSTPAWVARPRRHRTLVAIRSATAIAPR